MATEKPNILLIVADDLGIDTFHIDDATDVATVQLTGTDSYPLPTLSRLVREGVHFTRAWAQPICAPTRATLFTGLHPWKTGIGDAAGDPTLPQTLPADGTTDLKTLADMVSDAGYQCSIYGKWDLGGDHNTGVPTARGWHRHEGILAGGLRFIDQNPPNRALYEQIIQQDVRYVSWEKVVGDACLGQVRENIKPEERTHMYATADQIFSARDWIKHVQGRPWWVTLSLFSPHDPFHVPPAGTYTIRFKDPANPTIQEMFVAMAESMDYYLGQFFNDTDPEIQNQLKNTVIIFLGDNGSQDELDDIRGDDKATVYIGGVHVPLIIADGGTIFGSKPCYLDTAQLSSEQHPIVHIADVFQTIIDIAGGNAPGYSTDSISLVPYLKDTASDQRFSDWQARTYNFGQFFVPDDIPPLAGRYNKLGECATISDGTYKLNYQNGHYEFSELVFDAATDITTERVTNDFQHPRARELWQALTTPGNPHYAEVTGKGKKFPPLPDVPIIAYQYVRLVALSEVNNNPWTSVAEFNLIDPDGNPLDRSAWQATSDSEDKPYNNVTGHAIDDNASSIWHTEWYHRAPPHPHTLHIDLGSAQQFSGFKYLPRQEMPNGRIKDYQLFASQDNSNWVLLASGTFPNTTEEQTVHFSFTATPAETGPQILGVGSDQYLWYRDSLTSEWVQVPNSGSVLAVTVMPDGKIVGVGTDQQLWYRDSLTSDWVQVPNSGSVIGITAMSDGRLIGVGTDKYLWYRNTLTSDWVQVPSSGSVIAITSMPDNRILGVGTDQYLWIWSSDYLNNGWNQVPGSGSVKSVTTLSDGKVVGVGTDNQLWCRDNLTSNWEQVPNSGSVIAITNGTRIRQYKEYH